MPLTPGTRLGPYEILSPLGAGGMAHAHAAEPDGGDLEALPSELAARECGHARIVRHEPRRSYFQGPDRQ